MYTYISGCIVSVLLLKMNLVLAEHNEVIPGKRITAHKSPFSINIYLMSVSKVGLDLGLSGSSTITLACNGFTAKCT